MLTVDEQVQVEEFQIRNFLRLGYSLYEATCAVDDKVDWHYVEYLLNHGCDGTLALRIAR